MPKRLIAVLLAVLLLLLGAYGFRNQILSAALPWLLQQENVRVLLLERLDAGWNGATIERLELAIGPEQRPLSLEQISLDYRLLSTAPVDLAIARANLHIPAGQGKAPPPSFSALISGLIKLPLQSMSIAELEITGLDYAPLQQPVTARLQRTDVGLEFWLQQPELVLALGIEHAQDNNLDAEFELDYRGGSVGTLELSIATGDQLSVEGTGQLDLQSLLQFLAALDLQPREPSSLQGLVTLDLSAVLPDILALPLPLSGRVFLHEDSNIELATTAGGVRATMAMNFTDGVELTLEPGPDKHTRMLASAASVSFTLQEDTHDLHGTGFIRDFECDLTKFEPCQLDISAQLEAPELNLDTATPIRLLQTSAQLDGHIEVREQSLAMAVSPGELLRAAQVQRLHTTLSDTAITAERPVALDYRISDGLLALEAERLAVLLPRLSVPGLNIATRALVEGFDLALEPMNRFTGSGRVSAPGINLQRPAGWLPALAFSADLEFDERAIDLSAGLGSIKQGELFSMSANYLIDAAELNGRLRSNDINFNATDKRLSGYFANWPYDWDILKGEIDLSSNFVWPGNAQEPTLGARIRSDWRRVSGNYADIVFTGLDASAVTDYAFPGKLVTPGKASLALESLDVGVPIEAINARFRIDTRRRELHLPSLEAQLFGGRVWTEDALLRANRASNRIDIGVDGLQLAQLLEHTGYEAIQATGSLSGLLPLDISTSGVTMQRGMLAAKPPGGVFRYQAELATNTNAALAQVSQVLSNYHYNIFQVEVDYMESGDLDLAMQLRGRNPDLDHTRPVHLNLNVTDNIPMLLKSLQSGRNITDIIGRRAAGD
jgi:hypothetical protein